jgi:SAM-dependent methyltransferase
MAMTDNQRTYESANAVRNFATLAELQPPERTILDIVRRRLPQSRMLDLGVGGGRTTVPFAEHAAVYVGVDYSAGMIEACHARFGRERWQFTVADARDLPFEDGSFDFVLFSFNGIDSVSHEDRQRVLTEIHRVLSRGGLFAFSAHNLAFAPSLLSITRAMGPRAMLWRLRLRLANPPLPEIQKRDWIVLQDGSLHGRLQTYYVRRAEQLRQLTAAGFVDVQVFQLDGEVAPEGVTDPWLYYMCVRG